MPNFQLYCTHGKFLRSKYFNPFVEMEYNNKPVGRSGKCQKRFNLWKYCEGMCDRNGLIENWQCTDFSEYPNAGRAWKTTTPTGIVLSRIWLISLILMNFVSLFFILKNGKQIRTCFAAISIFGFTLLTNSYVYNLMESQALIENEWTSYYPVNAHNSGSVRFLCRKLCC